MQTTSAKTTLDEAGAERTATAPDFWERGYVVADDLIDAGARAFVKAGMDASERDGRMRSSPTSVARDAINEYYPIAGEAILLQCRAKIEKVVERELAPAYALWRIYHRGATLRRHIDRGACEISATVPIYSETADIAWPIHVLDLHGQERAIPLMPGQVLIYQGCRLPHWREPFTGDLQYQLFLHYVIADGDKAAHAYDGRGRTSLDLRSKDGSTVGG